MAIDLTIFDEDEFGKSLVELTLDELTSLGTELLSYAQILGQRTALMTYEAGRVLFEIRARLKEDGKWVSWQEEQGLARSTVGNVIALYERVQDIKRLEGMTIMEAYRKFGVLAPKKGEQKALPKPDDDLASNGDRPSPSLLDCPEDKEDEGMKMDEGREHSEDPLDEVENAYVERTDERDQLIDESVETIAVDRETLQESLEAITKDLVKAVVAECVDDIKVRFFLRLGIEDEEMPLAHAALGGLFQGKPIEADARLEIALDEIYSAIHRVQDVLEGSAKETAWLFEKMILAAQGRLRRAG
jgi:hypothetical protein